jgi:hypothetical protein
MRTAVTAIGFFMTIPPWGFSSHLDSPPLRLAAAGASRLMPDEPLEPWGRRARGAQRLRPGGRHDLPARVQRVSVDYPLSLCARAGIAVSVSLSRQGHRGRSEAAISRGLERVARGTGKRAGLLRRGRRVRHTGTLLDGTVCSLPASDRRNGRVSMERLASTPRRMQPARSPVPLHLRTNHLSSRALTSDLEHQLLRRADVLLPAHPG